MTLLERLNERWERMDGAAATKIDRILKERREAATEIEKLRGVLQDVYGEMAESGADFTEGTPANVAAALSLQPKN